MLMIIAVSAGWLMIANAQDSKGRSRPQNLAAVGFHSFAVDDHVISSTVVSSNYVFAVIGIIGNYGSWLE